MTRFLCAVSFAVLLACSDPAVDNGFVWANHGSCSPTAVNLSAAQHDSIPDYPPGLPLTYDQRFYRAAQHTPGGFAGLYLESVNGGYRTVLMFVDTTNASAELDSLTLYHPGWHSPFASDSVRRRLVRWNWVQRDPRCSKTRSRHRPRPGSSRPERARSTHRAPLQGAPTAEPGLSAREMVKEEG
jgi:hypothetical protein